VYVFHATGFVTKRVGNLEELRHSPCRSSARASTQPKEPTSTNTPMTVTARGESMPFVVEIR
jgi:hypothetical protein